MITITLAAFTLYLQWKHRHGQPKPVVSDEVGPATSPADEDDDDDDTKSPMIVAETSKPVPVKPEEEVDMKLHYQTEEEFEFVPLDIEAHVKKFDDGPATRTRSKLVEIQNYYKH